MWKLLAMVKGYIYSDGVGVQPATIHILKKEMSEVGEKFIAYEDYEFEGTKPFERIKFIGYKGRAGAIGCCGLIKFE